MQRSCGRSKGQKKGNVAATPEWKWTDLDSGLCYKGDPYGSLVCLHLSPLT